MYDIPIVIVIREKAYLYSASAGRFTVCEGTVYKKLYDDLRGSFVTQTVRGHQEEKRFACASKEGTVYNAVVWLSNYDLDQAKKILIDHEEGLIAYLQEKINNHLAKIDILKGETPSNHVSNGDFSNGITGWSIKRNWSGCITRKGSLKDIGEVPVCSLIESDLTNLTEVQFKAKYPFIKKGDIIAANSLRCLLEHVFALPNGFIAELPMTNFETYLNTYLDMHTEIALKILDENGLENIYTLIFNEKK
jgi:hypothetical protein